MLTFPDGHQTVRDVRQGEHQRRGDVPGRDRAGPPIEERPTKPAEQSGRHEDARIRNQIVRINKTGTAQAEQEQKLLLQMRTNLTNIFILG